MLTDSIKLDYLRQNKAIRVSFSPKLYKVTRVIPFIVFFVLGVDNVNMPNKRTTLRRCSLTMANTGRIYFHHTCSNKIFEAFSEFTVKRPLKQRKEY